MDLRHFDTSEVTPILVKLYDKHKDYAVGHSDKPKMRVELTNVISDLLNVELNARERELVSDVLIALLRQAEGDLRQALAEKLAVVDNVPLRLVLEMANDEISVAGPILRKSTVLGDLDLIYLIKSKNAHYWREIAKRRNLNAHVIDVLSDTKDFETALTLVKNENLELTDHAISVLADIAQGHEKISTPLLRRDEIGADIAKSLMGYVGEAMKAYIKERYDLKDLNLEQDINDIVFEMGQVYEVEASYEPDEKMIENAALLGDKKVISPALLVKTLKRQQYRMFMALFAQWGGISPARVIEHVQGTRGYSFAALCKSCGMNKADFVSLYLLTNSMRSDHKSVKTDDFNKAAEYFDMLDPELAQKILQEY